MTTLCNIPEVKFGVVGVSRDCFPASLTRSRLDALAEFLKKKSVKAYICRTVVENESDALAALGELAENGVNALLVYLGNFGPESPTTLLMKKFGNPCMVAAAAEEDKKVLMNDRGDALCGLLNNSYNQKLRGIKSYIPQYPVGSPKEIADQAAGFIDIARTVIGVRNLKIIGFGPRPQDFMACNAPIKPLYDLGVEVQENSELDLLLAYKEAASETKLIAAVTADMNRELGKGKKNPYPDILPKLAQLEVALLQWKEKHAGASKFVAFANKCWPSFEPAFGFVPCYVNSRLTGSGIPVACEVDLYGALSEYMAICATSGPATLLDINNSVPSDVLPKKCGLKGAQPNDLFMGFHCGNTCSECLADDYAMKYQLIMNRGLENGGKPDITRGTLEGSLKAGPITFFRLQSNPAGALSSYIAEGEILDAPPQTFGGAGIFAIPGFARFYRHILIGNGYPHHGAVAFKKAGSVLFEAVKLLGVDNIGVPLPDSLPYPGENLFELFAARK
ncbi:MAG: fucose isomerase [Candidatus Accumulibacter sp.]|jgi:L-fucose isomerase-like protein|nr:fucose isomerase [Accumulibacter sp.]